MSQAFKIVEFPILLLFYLTMWLKFSFFEKATKMCSIVLTIFKFSLVNVKTIRTIAHIFVAFPEKLNFKAFEV